MRVVIDTNDFFSSSYGGNPRKVIDLWHFQSSRISANCSEEIVTIRSLQIQSCVNVELIFQLFLKYMERDGRVS